VLGLDVDFSGVEVGVRILTAQADGYRLRLVDHPPSFDRASYYGENGADYGDNGFRFTLLGRAALETMRVERRPVDVLHVHDWEGVPALLSLLTRYADDPLIGRPATMLTCHNLAYHGWVPRHEVGPQLDIPAEIGDGWGVDLLREGVYAADIVNTVSPGYARESLTAEYGSGLDEALRSRGDRYIGILNGIDTALWNPATDESIPQTFAADNLSGKAVCRQSLLDEFGLDGDGPLLGMVSRLDPMKGFDLVAEAAPDIIGRGGRLLVLGTGDLSLVERLTQLATERPTEVAVVERFDRALSRRIYAGADAFLMPSRFEPCGQGQMIAMRYGTLPIVRATGGLADTITDADLDREGGNGFSFGPADAAALYEACRRAISAYEDVPRWAAIQQVAMAVDHSWAGPARDYLAAYDRASEIARGS
jgi:starch synthase